MKQSAQGHKKCKSFDGGTPLFLLVKKGSGKKGIC